MTENVSLQEKAHNPFPILEYTGWSTMAFVYYKI